MKYSKEYILKQIDEFKGREEVLRKLASKYKRKMKNLLKKRTVKDFPVESETATVDEESKASKVKSAIKNSKCSKSSEKSDQNQADVGMDCNTDEQKNGKDTKTKYPLSQNLFLMIQQDIVLNNRIESYKDTKNSASICTLYSLP